MQHKQSAITELYVQCRQPLLQISNATGANPLFGRFSAGELDALPHSVLYAVMIVIQKRAERTLLRVVNNIADDEHFVAMFVAIPLRLCFVRQVYHDSLRC